ncbi:MAG TPA: HAMP domain-containing sensor histidine kinase, partial [Anaeromyxobacter sp.]
MIGSRFAIPALAGALGLAGSLVATLFLYRVAATSVDRVLEERLLGAGETAAGMLARVDAGSADLRPLMVANGLEGAYLVTPSLMVVADANGRPGRRADLLRTDAARVRRAVDGEVTVAFAYAMGDQPVATGYFPVRGPDGAVRVVLGLEAGQAFAGAHRGLRRAFGVAIALSFVGALALAMVARRWALAEAARRREGERGIRGDALARMGAMVAHEIRNPLGVIRGSAELVRARSGAALSKPDGEALLDIIGEADRLRRLTDDFLDLARDPAIAPAALDVSAIAEGAARAVGRSHGALALHVEGTARAHADPARLHQVLSNLLVNASQAGARNAWVRADVHEGTARIVVRDDGPGVDPAVRPRLFEPFATGRAEGTGLGLALSKRLVELHGG